MYCIPSEGSICSYDAVDAWCGFCFEFDVGKQAHHRGLGCDDWCTGVFCVPTAAWRGVESILEILDARATIFVLF